MFSLEIRWLKTENKNKCKYNKTKISRTVAYFCADNHKHTVTWHKHSILYQAWYKHINVKIMKGCWLKMCVTDILPPLVFASQSLLSVKDKKRNRALKRAFFTTCPPPETSNFKPHPITETQKGHNLEWIIHLLQLYCVVIMVFPSHPHCTCGVNEWWG